MLVIVLIMITNLQLLNRHCQGTTCFPLQKHLEVFPTLTSDTFGILQTLTASEFRRHFRVLLIPSVRALARLDLFPFLSPFSLYGLSYCMPELTSLTSHCAPS